MPEGLTDIEAAMAPPADVVRDWPATWAPGDAVMWLDENLVRVGVLAAHTGDHWWCRRTTSSDRLAGWVQWWEDGALVSAVNVDADADLVIVPDDAWWQSRPTGAWSHVEELMA